VPPPLAAYGHLGPWCTPPGRFRGEDAAPGEGTLAWPEIAATRPTTRDVVERYQQ